MQSHDLRYSLFVYSLDKNLVALMRQNFNAGLHDDDASQIRTPSAQHLRH
jgi:hypothetical protein